MDTNLSAARLLPDRWCPRKPTAAPPSAAPAEIHRLYGKYNPEKRADVPTLVAKYGEDKLLGMVRTKYKQQEAAQSASDFVFSVAMVADAADAAKAYSCAVCGNIFPSAQSLGGHRRHCSAESRPVGIRRVE